MLGLGLFISCHRGFTRGLD